MRFFTYFIAFLTFIATATAALAANYGAIAYSNSSGAWGTAYNYGSRTSAEQAALSRCSGDCAVVVWFRNACGALATTADHAYGYGWAYDLGVAQNIALRHCSQYGSCGITAWACTDR